MCKRERGEVRREKGVCEGGGGKRERKKGSVREGRGREEVRREKRVCEKERERGSTK